MDSLKKFIDDARATGWDDERIRQTLGSSGWQPAQIDAALNGLHVPLPPAAAANPHAAGVAANHPGRPSITALQAALQHVLLWVFTLTSSIMIGVVSAALFSGYDNSSADTLLTYVVLEAVTFAPFAVLYVQYLRRLKREPELTTGKVWSIITIVLHSLGLIASVIGFILVLILSHNDGTTAGLVGSGTIGVMDALVVLAYVFANFSKAPHSPLRKRYLRLFPVLLFVLIALLGVIALLRVGSLRADTQTKKDLSATVSKVHAYARDNDRLPSALNDIKGAPSGVSYQKVDDSTYKVCASFKKDHNSSYDYSNGDPTDDSYVSDYDFDSGKAGRNCWSFENTDLADQGDFTTDDPANTPGVQMY